jgi:hypothetical protein
MRPVANEGVWGFGAQWERKEGREEEEGGEKAAGGAARRLSGWCIILIILHNTWNRLFYAIPDNTDTGIAIPLPL